MFLCDVCGETETAVVMCVIERVIVCVSSDDDSDNDDDAQFVCACM